MPGGNQAHVHGGLPVAMSREAKRVLGPAKQQVGSGLQFQSVSEGKDRLEWSTRRPGFVSLEEAAAVEHAIRMHAANPSYLIWDENGEVKQRIVGAAAGGGRARGGFGHDGLCRPGEQRLLNGR